MSFPSPSLSRTPHDWPRQMGGCGPNGRVASGAERDSFCWGRAWEVAGPVSFLPPVPPSARRQRGKLLGDLRALGTHPCDFVRSLWSRGPIRPIPLFTPSEESPCLTACGGRQGSEATGKVPRSDQRDLHPG